MLKTLGEVNSLLRTILILAILAAIGSGGWFVYKTYFAERWEAQRKLKAQEAEIAALSKDLEAKTRENERLTAALRFLKVDHRVAQIDVVGQQGSAETGDLVTHFTFVELDKDKKPLEEPRLFSVKGDIVYVDSLVIKFDDEYVEKGDPLRSTSLCSFRRIFGESQNPSDGFRLDPVGSQPAAYRTGEKISDFERELWANFWDYANDPAKARTAGLRAIHGEAPFERLIPGKRYEVELRASGGLSFGLPVDIPRGAKPGPRAETL